MYIQGGNSWTPNLVKWKSVELYFNIPDLSGKKQYWSKNCGSWPRNETRFPQFELSEVKYQGFELIRL